MRLATEYLTRCITALVVVLHVVVGFSASSHSVRHGWFEHRSGANCSAAANDAGHVESHEIHLDGQTDHTDASHLCSLCSLFTSGTLTSPVSTTQGFTPIALDWGTRETTIVLRDLHRSFSPRSPPASQETAQLL